MTENELKMKEVIEKLTAEIEDLKKDLFGYWCKYEMENDFERYVEEFKTKRDEINNEQEQND